MKFAVWPEATWNQYDRGLREYAALGRAMESLQSPVHPARSGVPPAIDSSILRADAHMNSRSGMANGRNSIDTFGAASPKVPRSTVVRA